MAGICRWIALLSLIAMASACATTDRNGPQAAFDIVAGLACSQAQLDAADPSCLVLSDPRASDSADRATIIADALTAAGYAPRKVWAFPAKSGDRVLGFSRVQNRGPCFQRRVCGGGWPYYVAVALPGPGGELDVIDPAILFAPADRTSWVSALVLGGRTLADINVAETAATTYRPVFDTDGHVVDWEDGDSPKAQSGLKAAYCDLPDRRADFRGHLALRGYERPRQAAEVCQSPAGEAA